MSRRNLIVSLLFAASCGSAPDAASCAAICDAAVATATEGTVRFTAFEQQVVGALLDDVRKGVRPVDERSLGVCRKGENVRTCDDWIGPVAEDLPEGEYVLFGSFLVPDIGERGTWKVRLETACTTTRVGPDGKELETSATYEKEYDVVHTAAGKGYTLSPLRRITSPNPTGRQACTWKIVSLHPDHPQTFEGRWSVPAKPPEP